MTNLWPKPSTEHIIVGVCTTLYDFGIKPGYIMVYNPIAEEMFDVDECNSWHWEGLGYK